MRRRTAIWLALVVAAVAAGVAIGVISAGEPLRPRHFGFYLLGISLAAGALLGIRGAALPFAGIVAFGIVRLVQHAAHPDSGEHEAGIIFGLYCIYFPLMFSVIAALGAALRRLVLAALAL